MKISVNGINYLNVPTGSDVGDALDIADLRGAIQIEVNGKSASRRTPLKDGNIILTDDAIPSNPAWTNVPDPHDCC